ncbi:UNVERIFIED_CONTAM: hypothetical protein LK11_00915 [Mumia flava]
MQRRRVLVALALAVSAVLVGITAVVSQVLTGGGPVGASVSQGQATMRPNIVLVLADDLDMSLVRTMPNVQALKRRGATFTNSFVVDSLCCTSRSALMTGMYPHNNRVFTNGGGPDKANPLGGYPAWKKHDDDSKSLAAALTTRAGGSYHTTFMGKFLNRYRGAGGSAVPQGWDEFHAITAGGYRMWSYKMTDAVKRSGESVISNRRYGRAAADYSTDVLRRMAVRSIESRERSDAPYFLEIAPFATHKRKRKVRATDPLFSPALRDRATKRSAGDCGRVPCARLRVRDRPGFNDDQRDNRPRYADGRLAAAWNENNRAGKRKTKRLENHYRNRARMAQSLDDLLGAVMRSVGPDTYVIFTSDNGYHLGEFRLGIGKRTAYKVDLQVPLIVAGPGVVTGSRGQVVQNIDLAPTIEQLAGNRPSPDRDGSSLVPVLRNPRAKGNRFAFVEHTWSEPVGDDPDLEGSDNLKRSYVAVRNRDALLVRYAHPSGHPSLVSYEFYRGLARVGSFEKRNQFRPQDPTVKAMMRKLDAYVDCASASCRALTR